MSDYNGYKNYNTWNIVLWMHNEEEAYRLLSRRATSRRKANLPWTKTTARLTVSAIFKTVFGDEKTPDGASVKSRDVDWTEVANALNENL